MNAEDIKGRVALHAMIGDHFVYVSFQTHRNIIAAKDMFGEGRIIMAYDVPSNEDNIYRYPQVDFISKETAIRLIDEGFDRRLPHKGGRVQLEGHHRMFKRLQNQRKSNGS